MTSPHCYQSPHLLTSDGAATCAVPEEAFLFTSASLGPFPCHLYAAQPQLGGSGCRRDCLLRH